MNVISGRYRMVSNQFRDLVYGLYGKTPTPVNPEVQKVALKGYKRGQTPITGRPADYLEPEMESARQKLGSLARTEEDVLTYVLYPTTGEEFLKWKYGLEPMPSSWHPSA
jgi:pyruvate/oxaloacetate carboxyltransferase